MYTLGSNPLASGINGGNYAKSVGTIITDNTNATKTAAVDTTNKVKAFFSIDYARWGSIVFGLILFTAGVFMLTHETKIMVKSK